MELCPPIIAKFATLNNCSKNWETINELLNIKFYTNKLFIAQAFTR